MSPPLDPGLQVERTGLAWTRTALGLTANAFLVLRAGVTGHDGPALAAGAVLVALAAGIALVGWRRPPRIEAAARSGSSPVEARAVRMTATAAGLAAAAALLAVLA